MRIRTGGNVSAGSLLSYFRTVLLVFAGLIMVSLAMAGIYMIKVFTPYCFEQMHLRKVCTYETTAVITDTYYKSDDDDTLVEYAEIEYTYNGRNYQTDIKIGMSGGIETDASDDSIEADTNYGRHKDDLHSDESYIGMEVKIFVDPDKPTRANYADGTKFYFVLALVGLGILIVPVIFLVIVFLVIRRKWKKKPEESCLLSEADLSEERFG